MSQTITIAVAGTVSTSAEVNRTHTHGVILVPARDAATLTWQVSADNSTFFPLNDEVGAVIVVNTNTAAEANEIPSGCLAANFFRIVAENAQDPALDIIVMLSND